MAVFGIRPDFIRSSIILKKLIKHPNIQLDFVYTGQHYDDELMGVFFREMNIPPPTIILDTAAPTDVQQHCKLIGELEKCINIVEPDCVIFLGDANAVMGCIAPLKMGIPIIHVEAGMRSHDWEMPEERNRKLIDSVSDVLYCYQNDYKCKLVQEGICPTKIVVTGNTIVDVINEHMLEIKRRAPEVLEKYKVKSKNYAIMTLHRNENMNREFASRILLGANQWASKHNMPIILPVMPRLQKIFNINADILNTETLSNYIYTEPLGFFDFVALEMNAAIEFTDSGTNQETSAILDVPCVVTRRSTERPETFKSNITVMDRKEIEKAADFVYGREKCKDFSLGDGNAAEIIVNDLVERLKRGIKNNEVYINNFRLNNWIDNRYGNS